MTLKVRRLIWDTWNQYHIKSKHNVLPEEALEVANNHALTLAGNKRKRLVIVGETREGRVLEVVLQFKGRGHYYVLTAYDAGSEVKAVYKRLNKGGDAK